MSCLGEHHCDGVPWCEHLDCTGVCLSGKHPGCHLQSIYYAVCRPMFIADSPSLSVPRSLSAVDRFTAMKEVTTDSQQNCESGIQQPSQSFAAVCTRHVSGGQTCASNKIGCTCAQQQLLATSGMPQSNGEARSTSIYCTGSTALGYWYESLHCKLCQPC